MSQPLTPPDPPNDGRKPSSFTKRLIKGLRKSIAALVLFAIAGLMMLLGLLWREHKTEITLPAPCARAS